MPAAAEPRSRATRRPNAACRTCDARSSWSTPAAILRRPHRRAALLGTDLALARLRGRVHDLAGVPVVATYHPAYLLRSPGEKPKAWDDLKIALKVLEGARGHGA